MSTERLKMLKDNMMACVESQIMGGHLDQVDAKELGEAVDMIKDFTEAIYYCTITDAMEEKPTESKYYTPMRDMDRMYYPNNAMDGRSMNYYGPTYPEMRDYREGRSGTQRKYYMESKEMNHPKERKMKELERYMQELSSDITEMINDATPEEKQMLQQKLNTLSTMIK